MPKTHLSHYSTFCSTLPTRSWSDASRDYNYGLNGKEKDSETVNDDFPITIVIGARMKDGSLGRWLSWHKELKSNLKISSFCSYDNNQVYMSDPDENDATNTRVNSTIVVSSFIKVYGLFATDAEIKQMQNAVNNFFNCLK